jgi:ankyrin repeat domain-containing protein 50
MAEAATVIQLIQFSGMVLSACYDYINKARSANSDVEKIHADVSGLEGILRRLDSLMSSGDRDRHALLRSLGRPNGPFDACARALGELQKRLKSLTEASNARRRLLWPLEEGKIRDILGQLSEQKQTFILALVTEEAENGDSDAQQSRQMAVRMDDMRDREERSKILSWLRGSDPSTNYNAARKKHEKGTGDWLLRSEQFQTWQDGDGGVMWLHGIPGAGKTILRNVFATGLG